MNMTLNELQQWMRSPEGEHLEFKEAKQNFHFEKLLKYCAALANEGGGRIVFGVTDKRPRRVVGSAAFADLARTKAGLIERLHLRIEGEELAHPDGRVLVFTVPSRPLGMPVPMDGAYWMRSGEDLAPMTPDMLKRIFDEAAPDFSAEVCQRATQSDLDRAAIKQFRRRWQGHSKNPQLRTLSDEQLLRDAGLIAPDGVTYASLILLGKQPALGQFLAQAEVVFEYRSTEVPGPANQRDEYRHGFLVFYDKLWETVNLRNDLQHYQEGFVMHPVRTFSEQSVREAILNAVSHRDYRHPGSVFVRQFPRRIEIVSPGGFPAGITPENILYRQNARNRLIADNLARCGLVERAGQGANRMFAESVRQGKRLPDFTHTDQFQVSLTLHGQIQDPDFLRFLEKVGPDRVETFAVEDLLVLDRVHREQRVPDELRERLRPLIAEGIIERMGRGRGVRYMLSRKFYEIKGLPGGYTRERGLDREQNKTLLLNHVRASGGRGCPLAELEQVLPALSQRQIKYLLQVLRDEGFVRYEGRGAGARWMAE